MNINAFLVWYHWGLYIRKKKNKIQEQDIVCVQKVSYHIRYKDAGSWTKVALFPKPIIPIIHTLPLIAQFFFFHFFCISHSAFCILFYFFFLRGYWTFPKLFSCKQHEGGERECRKISNAFRWRWPPTEYYVYARSLARELLLLSCLFPFFFVFCFVFFFFY